MSATQVAVYALTRIELARIVKAPRDRVFEAITDNESWPEFSKLFTRVTVTERTESTVQFDAELKVMGRKFKRTEKHVLAPPEQILVEGKMTGMSNTSRWEFQAVPEGTLVNGVVEVRHPGMYRLLGILTDRMMRNSFAEWLEAFARYVEAK